METRIICIGYDLPGYQDIYYSYSGKQSLLDADIVLFEPDFSNYGLDHDAQPYFQGKKCFSKDDSFNVQEDTSHWKNEISTALKNGKTVFVFLKEYEEVYVHTGQKQFSGTGRNTRTTNMVTGYNNYKFFPIELPVIVPKHGASIIFSGNNIFSTFWAEYKDSLSYESYLDEKIDGALFFNTNRREDCRCFI